jgi:hypothetical protein
MRMPRIIGPAYDIEFESERRCERCEKPLKNKIAWLELDQRNDTFHDFGGVPPDLSQGFFHFGIDCAKALIAEAEGKPIREDC